MKIESLTPHLGAKVWGINLSEPMSDETFSQIQALMRDWSVLVFPCLLYTSPSPRDATLSRMPSSA